MEIFLWILGSYIVSGCVSVVMFSKLRYANAMAVRKESYSRTTVERKQEILQLAINGAMFMAMVWPIFLLSTFTAMMVLKDERKQEQKILSEAETAKIIEEYKKEQSWENKYKALVQKREVS